MNNHRIAACMGGWCKTRDKCPHHFAVSSTPAERLCVPGQDGVILTDHSTGATAPLPAIFHRTPKVLAITDPARTATNNHETAGAA